MKTKFAHVKDIDIAYKVLGKGYPLIMIMGYLGAMECWDKKTLRFLSRHYKVVIFDNRGMGETSASDKEFSIGLFADDISGLMKALNIKKANILGWSMGSNIAIEFALKYPGKINKLVLYAADCGGSKFIHTNPRRMSKKKLYFSKYILKLRYCGSQENIDRQTKAVEEWKGAYFKLARIKARTLVITGMDDILVLPANSSLIAKKIKNSWLVQIKDAGHGIMYQYPKGFSSIVHTFLQA